MTNQIIAFLGNHSILFVTLHVLAVAVGLGGATISDVLFFKFLKDKRISKKEQEVLHVLKDIILTAIIAIWIFGLAVYLPESARYNASPAFLVKTIVVCIVTINGIALHMYIAPYLIHFNLRSTEIMGKAWRHLAFALGAVSVVSWYTAFFIAMLKTILPSSFTILFTTYVGVLLLGIVGSQITEALLTHVKK